MAFDGSMNRPPSENESGVTLRIPMISGRPSASRPASGLGACFLSRAGPAFGREAIMLSLCAGRAIGVKRPTPSAPSCPGRQSARSQHARYLTRVCRSVRDLLRQLAGVLDPAGDKLFRREKANQFSLLVGFGHGSGKLGGISISQFLHRMDTDFAQQPGIFLAHALDAELVGD